MLVRQKQSGLTVLDGTAKSWQLGAYRYLDCQRIFGAGVLPESHESSSDRKIARRAAKNQGDTLGFPESYRSSVTLSRRKLEIHL
jgi:hypothetical protein